MSVYAVYWPELNVFKVGTSSQSRSRWRAFLSRGAVVLDVVDVDDMSDYDFEDACHTVLREVCRYGFDSANEAVPYLGGQGGGYAECYRVPGDLMPSEILPFIDSLLDGIDAQA